MLLNDRYLKMDEEKWYDKKLDKFFSHSQYQGSKHGKDFSYLDSKEDYVEGPRGSSRVRSFLTRAEIPLEHSNMISKKYDDEVIIEYLKNDPIDLTDQTILILGGGPSTNLVNWQDIKYDNLIACNKFYKNKKILEAKPSIISLAPFVDLSYKNTDLHDYIQDNDCLLSFEPEHFKPQETKQVKEFCKKYLQKTFVFQTRYCSALGIGARQLVLSILLGAKKIYFTGIDFWEDEGNLQHAYELDKPLPRWRQKYGKDFQDRQVITLFDYINKLKSIYDFDIINLSEDLECNKSVSFVTKNIFK